MSKKRLPHQPQNQGRHALPALVELQARSQWVCWRHEPRKDTKGQHKWTKIPYTPRTGRRAASDNPRTWASYDEAVQAYERSQQDQRPYDGIGYVFHGDVTGIDLDHCVSATGAIDLWAQRYLQTLNSYSERSPGDGIHILVHGQIPKGIRRGLHQQAHPQAAIEIYSRGRYFTITGKHLSSTPTTIEARQEALETLYQEVMRLADEQEAGAGETHSHDAIQRQTNVSIEGGQGNNQYPSPVRLDDEQLLQKAVQASNGDKFHALFYQGNTSGYPSASEADMALCMLLAFWTGKDLERMDRLYRKSALYRDKWDSARSESTYGWETLHRAAARCLLVYDSQQSTRQLEQDINQVLQQIATERAARKRQGKPYQITPKEVDTEKVLHYLDMNEYGDALFFAAVFSGQVCYDHTESTWYLWNGHHWKKDTTGKVRQLVAGVLGTLYLKTAAALNTTQAELGLKIQAAQSQAGTKVAAEIAAWQERYKVIAEQMSALQKRAKDLRSAKRNANVLRFVESEMGITSDIWDTDPWLLAVPNGVLDLRTGTCRDGEPGDYIRTVAPTEWTGLDTPCPRFQQFLHEVFADKPDGDELIAFLHRLLGYCLTGLTTPHVFPILYGPEGRNGKDTLLGILKAVLGALVGAIGNDVFIAQDKLRVGGAATPHLSALQGKRLAWGSETRQGDRLNVAQLKQLTGGGDISTRPPYARDFYTFAPTHKLFLMTNYKPHAEARDKAFWSRACLIEFSLRFVENPKEPNERQADPNLKETLQQEGSGILAWLVCGCLSFQQQGLNIPASVQLATDKYRDEEDRLLLFIQECCLVKSEASVKGSAFYEAYKKWCEDNQMGRALSGKDFGQEMKKRFPKSSPSNGRIIYRGVGLLAPDDDPQPRSLFDAQEQATSNEKRESVEGASFPTTVNKSALEANRAQEHAAESRGSEGHGHKLSQNHQYAPSYRGVLGKHPLHPLHPHPVTISQRASEAEGQEVESQKALSPDPLLTNSQVASEAEAQQVEDQKAPSTDPLLEEVWEDETL